MVNAHHYAVTHKASLIEAALLEERHIGAAPAKGVPRHFHPNTLPEDFSSYGPMDVDGEEDLNFGREGPRVVKLPPGMPPAPLSPGPDSREERWD